MKGSINPSGHLAIERADNLKKQMCYRLEECACGDWCPMFGEPKLLVSGTYESYELGRKVITTRFEDQVELTICEGKTFKFVGFVDKRIQKEG